MRISSSLGAEYLQLMGNPAGHFPGKSDSNLRLVVQSLSCVLPFANPWTAAHRQVPLSFTTSQGLLKFTSIESVMLSNRR